MAYPGYKKWGGGGGGLQVRYTKSGGGALQVLYTKSGGGLQVRYTKSGGGGGGGGGGGASGPIYHRLIITLRNGIGNAISIPLTQCVVIVSHESN